MPELHVLRVFTNDEGEWGNPLGVFIEGGAVAEGERQRVATDLGFSETVFVDDPGRGVVQIFTPAVEIPFAGHPLVGTAWLLGQELGPVEVLRPPPGEVGVREEDGMTYISGRAEWAPDFEWRRLDTPGQVHALEGPPPDAGGDVYVWAWIDEAVGTIRARSFAPDYGIAEDEATGSAVLALCAQLDRPITVHQGHGSVLVAHPLDEGRAEVGGSVALDETRDYQLG